MRAMNWLVLAAATTLVTAPAAAQDWSWKGRVQSAQWMEVKGINGSVRAVASTGSEIEVEVTKTARKSDPDDVKMVVLQHAGGVTICAVYPTPAGKEQNECAAGDRGRMSTNNNDVKVDFLVRVPRGTKFIGRTVNGGVNVTGMTADARGYTVNGSVVVRTTGLAQAGTVNGSIEASMGRANWSDVLEFETVNGGIVLEMPSELDTEVEAATVNGSIEADYPLTIRGKWGPKRMTGTIGRGGRELILSTVNGNIELRSRN